MPPTPSYFHLAFPYVTEAWDQVEESVIEWIKMPPRVLRDCEPVGPSLQRPEDSPSPIPPPPAISKHPGDLREDGAWVAGAQREVMFECRLCDLG